MVIRSALFNIGFWLWIFVLGLAGLPLSLVYRPFAYTVARIWAKGSLFMLKVLCGITHEIRGAHYIPKGAAIIASKHQSAWDTVVFWALLPKPTYVLKRELIFFPVFGWYLLLLKCIYIDRKAGAGAMRQMLRAAKERAAEGVSIVIFPEGTRTLAGAESAYYPGVAALYQHLDLPLVPVALDSGLFWSRNAFTKKPGVITIEFLPPIPPGMKSREMMPVLKERMETATRALVSRHPAA